MLQSSFYSILLAMHLALLLPISPSTRILLQNGNVPTDNFPLSTQKAYPARVVNDHVTELTLHNGALLIATEPALRKVICHTDLPRHHLITLPRQVHTGWCLRYACPASLSVSLPSRFDNRDSCLTLKGSNHCNDCWHTVRDPRHNGDVPQPAPAPIAGWPWRPSSPCSACCTLSWLVQEWTYIRRQLLRLLLAEIHPELLQHG
ncbi:hypothetical protein VOLCADRAFT_107853 [Volvox carteri f. nagariensis]|uniref:Pherophorin domain-containing protein n=1 Tax=Volvox carteri f. nagariensis TaxID=3068 RepID=D8UGV4_VOLCA|nr:uncharacterized protein VOLCADRAFT_107853 [Volvox carteri f. nagariensis]EFJ41017.1 hypothetical protein VOLCADRAFT_107853 [Volvox carteri f. nagariensis]|eukprot:XP_002957881.1 hypothetical protein VOLCADRAFT_107853 [Volvox carteri f. nagariensis]